MALTSGFWVGANVPSLRSGSRRRGARRVMPGWADGILAGRGRPTAVRLSSPRRVAVQATATRAIPDWVSAPVFHLAESQLCRRCVDDAAFDWDIVDHGEQERGRFDEELSELDAVEVEVAAALTEAEAAAVLAEHPEYPAWSAMRLKVRGVTATPVRQAATVLVRQALVRARTALRQASLEP